ncbi:MAG: hypothetical protein OEM59_19090 [Rhodospirillales bacterium]|nr:hypothetical protein [Rhodospirillales bacterium]
MGKGVLFARISVTAERGTAAVLADYRRQIDAGEGWILLTGENRNIGKLSYPRRGIFPPAARSASVGLGNARSGQQRRRRPDTTPAAVAAHAQRRAVDPAGGFGCSPRGGVLASSA